MRPITNTLLDLNLPFSVFISRLIVTTVLVIHFKTRRFFDFVAIVRYNVFLGHNINLIADNSHTTLDIYVGGGGRLTVFY